MTLTTLRRVKDAREYVEKVARGELWLGVARDYAWQDEQSPPTLSPYLQVIPDLICIVQIKSANLSRIINNHLNTISLNTPIRELVLTDSYFVDLSAYIPTQNLQTTLSYRVTSIISNVVLTDDALGPVYLPSEIKDYDIDWFNTHTEVIPSAGEVHKINVVRSF